jgi:OPA family glycerol-3-phosphate transporter-like MFS transporter
MKRRLAVWQGVTIALLFIGYAGYYLCRSDFSVSLPLMIDELAARGMSADAAKIRLGAIASFGVFAYAIGKFFLGGIADFLGGRRNFLVGMGGSVLFTLLFSLGGGMPIFTLAWVGNRLVQSTGWAGMVKITSRWFSYSAYGAVMGVISLSYLFGDAVAREFMGMLIGHGLGWRMVFQIAGATLAVIFILTLVLLKESRKQVGFEEPSVNPLNLFGAQGHEAVPCGLRELLGPLFRSPAFWLVCLLSLGTTLVRETFNTWTPTYFHQVAGYSQARAAGMSAVFPLFGGVSVLLSGFLSDRMGRTGRASIMFYSLLGSAVALFALASLPAGAAQALSAILVGAVGFLVIGPYSYLAGAFALDFGGKHGSATSSGIIDGVGYLGGILAGDTMARISVSFGWAGAFLVLAGMALLGGAAAAVLLLVQRRTPAAATAPRAPLHR